MAGKHVMISYNWSHKDRALLIAELLKKYGLSVWMDVEGGIQQGDINKCMASGVEKAYAIVCLVSEKYQHSKNCRRELSYADIQNLPIFPCKVEEGYEGTDWLGLLTAGLLYYDFRGDDKEVENTLINAIKSISKEKDIKIYSEEEEFKKQKEIFDRDFRGRIYQKEGPWPVQYGFESFDNIWIDWSHYYYEKTCVRRDGSFVSSQEVKRKKFRDVQFIGDRTFLGTIYWDDKDYWSNKSGENSFWKYYIRLSEDLSRVESGKLMYVDKNNEVIDYKYYGKQTFYYDAVDASGTGTSGEMCYILHKIIDSSEDREDVDAGIKAEMQAERLEENNNLIKDTDDLIGRYGGGLDEKDIGTLSGNDNSTSKESQSENIGKNAKTDSHSIRPEIVNNVEMNASDTIVISRQEYEELKAYKQKYLDLKALLRVASSY